MASPQHPLQACTCSVKLSLYPAHLLFNIKKAELLQKQFEVPLSVCELELTIYLCICQTTYIQSIYNLHSVHTCSLTACNWHALFASIIYNSWSSVTFVDVTLMHR